MNSVQLCVDFIRLVRLHVYQIVPRVSFGEPKEYTFGMKAGDLYISPYDSGGGLPAKEKKITKKRSKPKPNR